MIFSKAAGLSKGDEGIFNIIIAKKELLRDYVAVQILFRLTSSVSLIVVQIQEKPGELVTYKEDETAQTAAFMHILRAIYRHPPMDVSKVEELIPLTELADFYCTLPSVSIALDGVMLRNLQSRWGANIRDNLDVYVRVATKLRNKTLFKECMVHVVSLWNSKLEKHISLLLDLIKDHPKIWKLAKNAHECICAKIDTVNQAIAKIIGYDDGNRPTETKLELAMPQAQRLVVADRAQYHMRMWSGSDFKTFASYYRSLLEDPFEITKVHIRDNCAWYLISKGKECSDDIAKQVHAAVRPLFEKNLVLDDSDDGAGQGIYKDCFLCAEISDEDLPWDVDQIEW